MSLIECAECGNKVSENAISCPKCGNPLKTERVEVFTQKDKPIEVELTNKKWKKVILMSVGIIILGFIIPPFLPGRLNSSHAVGWTIVFFGVVGLVIGKVGAWYSNR